MPLAPWLPPITNNSGRSGSKPSAARQALASRGLKDALTGVPVMVIFRLFSRRAAESKPTNARLTTHDNHRFARPGIVLDSCRNVCAPHRLPARIGGALVKPPIAKTA